MEKFNRKAAARGFTLVELLDDLDERGYRHLGHVGIAVRAHFQNLVPPCRPTRRFWLALTPAVEVC